MEFLQLLFLESNTLISRETFHPPISEHALNKYTLNIIPDRDIVPMIDDPTQNYQRINCGAPDNDPFNCHRKFICAYLIKMCATCISSHVALLLCVSFQLVPQRSVCEILFTCGSNGRLIPCHCVKILGTKNLFQVQPMVENLSQSSAKKFQ